MFQSNFNCVLQQSIFSILEFVNNALSASEKLNARLEAIQAAAKKLARHFCEDEDKFQLNECFALFSDFLHKTQNTIKVWSVNISMGPFYTNFVVGKWFEEIARGPTDKLAAAESTERCVDEENEKRQRNVHRLIGRGGLLRRWQADAGDTQWYLQAQEMHASLTFCPFILTL